MKTVPVTADPQVFFICVSCGEHKDEKGESRRGVHHYLPPNGCSRCGCPFVMEVDSRFLPETEHVLKLRRKWDSGKIKSVRVNPVQDQGIEIMAKTKTVKKTTGKKHTFVSGIPVGKTSGLRIQAWWAKTFEDNAKHKKTDDEIRLAFLKEFPTAKSKLISQLASGVLHRVQALRNRYNKGALTGGVAPKSVSHRYDEHGNYNDTKFSGKAGVTMEDLDTKYIPKTEPKERKPALTKKTKTPTKKIVVRRKKQASSVSDKSTVTSAAAGS